MEVHRCPDASGREAYAWGPASLVKERRQGKEGWVEGWILRLSGVVNRNPVCREILVNFCPFCGQKLEQ